MSIHATHKGYLVAALRQNLTDAARQVKVHRLVAAAFLGRSELDVNHKDGDKTNNNLANIEYCTRAYNCQHAYATGLNDPAKHAGIYSVSEIERERVLRFYWQKAMAIAEIARATRLAVSTVTRIVDRSLTEQINQNEEGQL